MIINTQQPLTDLDGKPLGAIDDPYKLGHAIIQSLQAPSEDDRRREKILKARLMERTKAALDFQLVADEPLDAEVDHGQQITLTASEVTAVITGAEILLGPLVFLRVLAILDPDELAQIEGSAS